MERISEQKKIHDKKIRKEYQEAKRNGENVSRKMYFFEQIIKSQGYSFSSLAEKTGFSAQLLGWWMVADDCYLSNVIKILNEINIGIEPSFEDVEKENVIVSGIRYEIRGTLPEVPAQNIKQDKGSEIVEMRIREGGNTKFLAQFIKDSGMTLSAFCRKIDTDFTCFRRWLINDEIRIGKIYQVAEVFGKKLIWTTSDLSGEQKL